MRFHDHLPICLALIFLLQALSGCQENAPEPSILDPSGEPEPEIIPLSAPVNLQAVETGDYFVNLAWADTNSRHPLIVVERRNDEDIAFHFRAELDPGTDEWEDQIDSGQTYHYRLATRLQEEYSDWTDSLTVNALPQGFWEVVPGISNDCYWGITNTFRFERTNRFYPSGILTIEGPEGWNSGEVFQRDWSTFYIGIASCEMAGGEFHLTFETTYGRNFQSTIQVDPDLVLELPHVVLEILPDRRLKASWSCTDAQRYSLCWGPAGGAGCSSVGTCTDTVLTTLESDPTYWLAINAHAEFPAGQNAMSGRNYTIHWDQKRIQSRASAPTVTQE